MPASRRAKRKDAKSVEKARERLREGKPIQPRSQRIITLIFDVLTHVYSLCSIIHMENFRRKQLILPQSKLNAAKKALGAKTDTETVILSLEAVLRQKKLESFADLPKKLRLAIDSQDLERTRRD